MSFLTEPLPQSVYIGRALYPINPDFRTILKIEELMNADGDESEKAYEVLRIFYREPLPEDIEAAVAGFLWFCRCGQSVAGGEGAPSMRPVFSFAHDGRFIYAAFLEQYGIDLVESNLHWWKFKALFECLKENCLFSEIRRCRGVSISKDMTPAQKKYYSAMKKLHALPLPKDKQDRFNALEAALLGDGNVMGILKG